MRKCSPWNAYLSLYSSSYFRCNSSVFENLGMCGCRLWVSVEKTSWASFSASSPRNSGIILLSFPSLNSAPKTSRMVAFLVLMGSYKVWISLFWNSSSFLITHRLNFFAFQLNSYSILFQTSKITSNISDFSHPSSKRNLKASQNVSSRPSCLPSPRWPRSSRRQRKRRRYVISTSL